MSVPPIGKISYGECQCGCKRKTKLSRDNDAPRGRVKGAPMRYCVGHNGTHSRQKLRPGLIPLPHAVSATVALDHYPDLIQFNWFVTAQGYVARNLSRTERTDQLVELMHRRILKALPGQYVDHIDGDRLNNVPANLRICTNSQNMMNRGLQTNSRSGYKGVSWSLVSKRWRAYIKVNGKQIHLGLFATKEKAASAYNKAAIKYHDEFAVLNAIRKAA